MPQVALWVVSHSSRATLIEHFDAEAVVVCPTSRAKAEPATRGERQRMAARRWATTPTAAQTRELLD